MNAPSPLMIVYADVSQEVPADQLAMALGFSSPEVIAGGMAQAIHALRRRSTPPSYIVIDIGARASEVLQELAQLAAEYAPGTPVVVLGATNDVRLYRGLIQLGISEYFAYPVQLADIRNVLLQRPAGDMTEQVAAGEGTAIAFMSAASGDGASTIAVNTAYALAEEFKKSVVIVDMDYQFGMIARQLDISAPFGIRELFEYPDRGVDATLISKMLVPYGDYMKIIAAPDELRLLPQLRPEVVRELIQVLKSQFEFVILDVPHTWTSWTAAALSHCDRTVVVSQLWLRSVTHFTRLLAAWREIGINRDAISLVINRSGAKFKEAITPQDFERVCHKSIDFHLANDIKAVVTAENQGKTIIQAGNSLLERQIRDLARSMHSLRHGDAAPAATAANDKKARFTLRGKK